MRDLLRERRSIRKYLERTVDLETMKRVFDAARYAPSAHNAQPWRFVIIDEPERKKLLAEAMAEEWDIDLESDGVAPKIRRKLEKDSIEVFIHSPVLIVACLSMEDMVEYPDEDRQDLEYLLGVQSLAASVQNLLLAACAEGLGATWYCAPVFCQDTVREVLGLPDHVDPQALITLGYPAEDPTPPPRLPLSDVVHYNRWGITL